MGNENLVLLGVVLSCVDTRNNLTQELLAFIKEHFALLPETSRELKTTISRSVKLEEAQGDGKTILQHMPNHKVSEQFRELARELESRLAKIELAEDSEEEPHLKAVHG